MPSFQIRYRPYRRRFARPLFAAWGTWSERRGWILQVTSANKRTGYGEVAPLPQFGSENLEQADAFLKTIPNELGPEAFEELMKSAPPATAFGLWCAREQATASGDKGVAAVSSAKLMSLADLTEKAVNQECTTIKVKLGISERASEQAQLERALAGLPPGIQLRLDPNRSWNPATFESWMHVLEPFRERIEFIEEPFPAGVMDMPALLACAGNSPIPLALDESLSEKGWQPWLENKWPGYWIIKPSLAGIPNWMEALQAMPDRIVLSSAFETGIGLFHLHSMAANFPNTIHGLGTGSFFNDDLGLPETDASGNMANNLQRIWTSLLTH